MDGGSPTQASAPAGAVFLSYASQDAEAAERICEALRTAGIEVWFDKSEFTCNFSFADVSSINKPDSHLGDLCPDNF